MRASRAARSMLLGDAFPGPPGESQSRENVLRMMIGSERSAEFSGKGRASVLFEWLGVRSREQALFIALGFLGVLAVGAEQLQRVGDFRVDDAYITFSFSKNLAAGNGPVFSHGLRVEGYSNFLWMVLVALGAWLFPGADLLTIARVGALGFLGLGLAATFGLARLAAGPFAALCAVALVVSSTDVFRAVQSGLETVPFMSAVVFGWYVYLREPPHRRGWSLAAFLPAALLRIDGFVPVVVVIGFELARSIVERRFSPRVLLRWVLPFAVVWGAYFAWRFAYYGLLWPTPVYAKSLANALERSRGFNQAWEFLRHVGGLALVPWIVLAAFRVDRARPLGLLSAVSAQVAYVGLVGGDWMPFHRFFLPVLPLAAVLSVWGVKRFAHEVRLHGPLVRVGALVLVIATFVFAAQHAHAARIDTPAEARQLAIDGEVRKHTHENLLASMDLARYVVRHPGDRFVTDYAGVFAVYTEATIIDMWGLCNADIALNGGIEHVNPIYGKGCPECYARLDPDYFHVIVPLVRSEQAFDDQRRIIDEIFQGPAIDRVIDLEHAFTAGRVVETATGRTFWFLERKRPGRTFEPREPAPGIRVDYPFEPG